MADADDEVQLADFPIVDTPVKMDYGYNVKYVSTGHPLLHNRQYGLQEPDTVTIGSARTSMSTPTAPGSTRARFQSGRAP
jgi:hypothetical protein